MSRQYREIETVRDPKEEGMVVVITQRMGSNPYFSARLMKEYVDSRDGEVKYTSFFSLTRHLDSAKRAMEAARVRTDVLEDQTKVRRARQGYSVP
jgi:hypothetical protein